MLVGLYRYVEEGGREGTKTVQSEPEVRRIPVRANRSEERESSHIQGQQRGQSYQGAVRVLFVER
jgi:hypothetical protein